MTVRQPDPTPEEIAYIETQIRAENEAAGKVRRELGVVTNEPAVPPRAKPLRTRPGMVAAAFD